MLRLRVPGPRTVLTAQVSSAGGLLPDGLSGQLGAAVQIQLPENVGQVSLDSSRRDEHPLGNLGIGKTLSDELDDHELVDDLETYGVTVGTKVVLSCPKWY
jgi:hypothetical protein